MSISLLMTIKLRRNQCQTCASRVILSSSAQNSAQLPMEISLYGSHRPSKTITSFSCMWPTVLGDRFRGKRKGALDMLSIPPAITAWLTPSIILCAPNITAANPWPVNQDELSQVNTKYRKLLSRMWSMCLSSQGERRSWWPTFHAWGADFVHSRTNGCW